MRTYVSILAGAGGMDWGFVQEEWLPATPATPFSRWGREKKYDIFPH